jgi:hypothetical protein
MRVTINLNLLLDFFLTFAAFEFALKTAGFIKKGRPVLEGTAHIVQADWERFIIELRGIFRSDHSPELLEACNRILDNPPWREITTGDELLWDATAENPQLPEVDRLLKYVRRIRNNLFHGGKFVNMPVLDLRRNAGLLSDALIILKECLRLSHKVRGEYESAIL